MVTMLESDELAATTCGRAGGERPDARTESGRIGSRAGSTPAPVSLYAHAVRHREEIEMLSMPRGPLGFLFGVRTEG